MAETREAIARLLREEAGRAGFHRFGIAPVEPWERHGIYERYIAEGRAGEMSYLAERAEERRDVRSVLAEARCVVTVGLSYARADGAVQQSGAVQQDGAVQQSGAVQQDGAVQQAAGGGPRGFLARYARGEDYHTLMKRRLQKMAAAVEARLGRTVAWSACVDTAPLLEREAAHRGGVGFLAKNTMIIAPGLGSYLLLGELLLDLDAAPTEAAEPRCGRCRACLDVCPTGAFDGAYVLDARRCISYLTIEARGAIPRALRPLVENMVFGCDRCQEVCPFNAEATLLHAEADPALLPLPKRDAPSLVGLLGLGAAQFRKFVQRSAMRRIHRAQLLRNVAVALGNVGGPGEVAALARALLEPSALVREHVAWALGQIAARHPESGARAVLEAQRLIEEEAAVREEIDLALAPAAAGV